MSPSSRWWVRCGLWLVLGIGAAHAAIPQPPAPAGPKALLRVASAFDPQTMDPHALALLYHSRVAFQIYEFLVNRDRNFVLEPALATSWKAIDATTWRFTLRSGVTFHDGMPFHADDAVFSIERALAKPSQRAFLLSGVKAVRKIDPQTIDLVTAQPDAVLPEKLQFVAMMSRAWCETRRRTGAGLQRQAGDLRAAPRQRHRTVPARSLRARRARGAEAARRLVGRQGHEDSIRSDATRLAALASGEVDLVLDPPFQDVVRLSQDPRLALTQTTDIGTQYFTFDQARAELEWSDVKGRNPFKDLRVRRAVAHAVNIELIVQKVLRGQATPTGALVSPRVDGALPELEKRLPHDPAKARALLKEAGYPDGFAVTLDCVNIAFRENVCQAAAAMLTQVGIRTTLRASPTNQFFPKLSQGSASFVEYGWTPVVDPWPTLNALLRTFDPAGSGTFNAGRYSNPKLDALIDAIRVEPDLTRRRAMVGTVLRLAAEEMPYLPLYRRALTWAMRKDVKVVMWPNDLIELRWVRVGR